MVILIDSCWYITHIKKGIDFRQLLLPALRTGEIYNCGVVRAEVLRGIGNPRLYAEVEAFFNIVPEVPTDAKLWQQVSRTAWEVARAGFSPPLTDFVIAACAQRARAALITSDKHFAQIPGIKVLNALP
jgi:predicted nucleic acid-binding protein